MPNLWFTPPETSAFVPSTAGANLTRKAIAIPAFGRHILVVVFAAAFGLPTLVYPWSSDLAAFAYVGNVWRLGGLPYRDAWDVKPPAVYALFALFESILGPIPWVGRALDIGITAAAALVLYRIAERTWGRVAAAAAAFSFVSCYYLTFNFVNTAECSSFGALPLAILIGICARAYDKPRWRDWFFGGLCVAVLALLKLPLSIFALLIIGPWLRSKSRASDLAAGLIGLAIPFVVTLLYFALRHGLGFLGELLSLEQQYAFGNHPKLKPWSIPWMSAVISIPGSHPVFVGAFLLAIATLLLRPKWVRSPVGTLSLCSLALTTAEVIFQHRFYLYHWLPMLPGMALIIGGWTQAAWNVRRSDASMSVRAVASGCVAGAFAIPWIFAGNFIVTALLLWTGRLSFDRYYQSIEAGDYHYRDAVAVARTADRVGGPGATLQCLNLFEPYIYLLADMRSPSRWFLTSENFPSEMAQRVARETTIDCSKKPQRWL